MPTRIPAAGTPVWPSNRTLKTFREWFEVSFSSIVVDLGFGRIEVDED